MTCLCGHDRLLHAGGDKGCESCPCPEFRPAWRPYTVDDEAADEAAHHGIAQALIAEHTLASEVGPAAAGMWIELPKWEEEL